MDQDKIKKLAQQILDAGIDHDGVKNFGDWLSILLPRSAREVEEDLLQHISSGGDLDTKDIQSSWRYISAHQRGKKIFNALKEIADHGVTEPISILQQKTLLLGHRMLDEYVTGFLKDRRSSYDIESGKTDLSQYPDMDEMDWTLGKTQAEIIKEWATTWGKDAADGVSDFAGVLSLYKRLLNEMGIPIPQRGRG